jgi:hypothetical protein
MRDGALLFADVYRPAAPGRYPTLLQRTPYDKAALTTLSSFVLRATTAGYAVVCQDVRGRFTSEGEFATFVHEREDGEDTLEWLVHQAWCDGNVGMFGQSYVGLTQWQAALSRHPALKAIVPTVTADNYHDGWAYQGGAFELGFNYSWTISNLILNTLHRRQAEDPSVAEDYQRTLDEIDATTEGFARLPLTGHPLLAKYAPYYDTWLAHPTYDDFWTEIDVSRGHSLVGIPALNIGGWYDIFLKGTIANFTGMRANAATPAARATQRLLIGPWNHSGMRAGNPIGTIDFGVRSTGAELDVDGMHLAWFDRWLRGVDNGIDDEPPVRVFVMGANRWRTALTWPLPGTDWQEWYFHSEGRANSLSGDGVLSRDAPRGEPPDSYIYNPRNPTPTVGGGLCCSHVFSYGGAFDQRGVEARDDVLVYTSAVLTDPVEVTGPIKVLLHAASSAVDTDFCAKLVDVAPCGCARNLNDGIIRARYRNSMSQPELITPGAITAYEIDLIATSNVFLPGHRIRLEIASANYPRFDRNPNTGALPGSGTELLSAMQTIFHSDDYQSRIILPIVPLD